MTRVPIIFDAAGGGENIPYGFTAVKVVLDGSLRSDLVWKDAVDTANAYIAKGFDIFWELDLGLFDKLKHPLAHTSQFMSLTLSIRHFRDTVWNAFRNHSAGVCLYKGSLDFSRGFPWTDDQQGNLRDWLKEHFGQVESLNREIGGSYDSFRAVDPVGLAKTTRGLMLLQLYCRDVTAEYLSLLAQELPEGLEVYLVLDGSGVDDPAHAANLLSKQHFSSVSSLVCNAKQGGLGYYGRELPETDFSRKSRSSGLGVCLPSVNFFKPSDYFWVSEIIMTIEEKSLSYRVIPEGLLVAEWELLDFLIVSSKQLSASGKRMLMGFCAAGGTVVTVGTPIGLPSEISIEEYWLQSTRGD